MLNYKQLYYFWSVAKYAGVTRAAEQLNLTPQTISGQLSELEQTLGTKLFIRKGKRLTLSSTGQIAFAQADEIFHIGNELEALLRGHQDEGDLVFRVGVSDVIPKAIAYQLLSPAIHITEPVRLICIEDKLDVLVAELAIHKIDLVITDRSLSSDLSVKGFSHLLGESPLAFYATNTLANQLREGFPRSLDGAPLLLPGKHSEARKALDRWFSFNNIYPRVKGEFDDSALMKKFGQEGIGVFPAPKAIANEIQRQHSVEIVGTIESLSSRYYAISAERKLRHPAVVAICDFAQNNLS